MNVDFSQPQRQSKIGILVLFFYALQQYARAFLPMFAIFIFKFDQVNKLYLFGGLALAIVLVAIISYLKYQNFTFFLDNESDEFIITEGILNKTKTAIQLNKIQQVNINQSFLQKLIGVYELSVDTAGSNDKEGAIKAISHPMALALKSRLLENETKAVVAETEEIQPETKIAESHPFIKISFLSLLKVGITSNYGRSLSLLLLFFFTIFENIGRYTDFDFIDDETADSYINENFNSDISALTIINSVVLFVLFLFSIVLIINIFRIIFRYFNYNIAKQKGSLLLSFGLLNTKNTIVKPEKVQITTLTQNYLQKKLKILEIKVRQATAGQQEEKKSAIEIPGCSPNESDEILKLLFRQLPEKGVMLKPNFRKLGFAVFLSIILPLAIYWGFVSWIEPGAAQFVYLVPIYVIIVGIIQYFQFRNYRLYINDNFIIKQSGAWDISNEIIEPMKIQAISVSQLFWHKSLNIGSLTLHTAGGNLSFSLGNFNTIQKYVNLWLYEMETSDSNWM